MYPGSHIYTEAHYLLTQTDSVDIQKEYVGSQTNRPDGQCVVQVDCLDCQPDSIDGRKIVLRM